MKMTALIEAVLSSINELELSIFCAAAAVFVTNMEFLEVVAATAEVTELTTNTAAELGKALVLEACIELARVILDTIPLVLVDEGIPWAVVTGVSSVMSGVRLVGDEVVVPDDSDEVHWMTEGEGRKTCNVHCPVEYKNTHNKKY